MAANKVFPVTTITLRAYDLGESDKILVLFSREKGVLRAVAKGIKKTTCKFGGRLDSLNVNELLLREGRNLNTISQCETIKIFPHLRLDYDKLIYSLFLGELVLLLTNEEEPVEEVFDLLIYTLETMQFTHNPLMHTIWFEMHLLTILGYKANLTSCDICQEEVPSRNEKLGFSLNTGSLICQNCLRSTSSYRIISDELRNTLKKLKTSGLEGISDFVPSEKILLKIQETLKEYLNNLSERKIKTLSVLEASIY